MRTLFLSILILVSALSCSSKQDRKQNSYKAMTYNIRYDNPDDGEDNWHNRKAELVAQIQKYSPDFLGTQEGLVHQIKYLDSTLNNYTYVGVGREDGNTKGEYTALFYNGNTWNCLQSKTFWLSETPDSISVGWDAALERICSYALFEHKATNKKIWVLNAHFDHQGSLARENSAKLILTKIDELQQSTMAPVVLMGDFNVTPEERPIQLFTKKLTDSFNGSESKQGTFNDFDATRNTTLRIDYIFTKNLEVKKCKIITEKRQNGHVLSDHFPVILKFKLQ